jgi:hypothetical protein
VLRWARRWADRPGRRSRGTIAETGDLLQEAGDLGLLFVQPTCELSEREIGAVAT